MSTSDQDGNRQLTRKQLRELRLTGSTPVISEEEAAKQDAAKPAPVLPRAAEPVVFEPAPVSQEDESGAARLTRRQAREQERIRTASVPVADETTPVDSAPVPDERAAQSEPAPAEAVPVESVQVEEPAQVDAESVEPVDVVPVESSVEEPDEEAPAHEEPAIVSAVPRFEANPAPVAPLFEPQSAPAAPQVGGDAADAVEETVVEEPVVEVVAEEEPSTEEPSTEEPAVEPAQQEGADRPMVGAAFGLGVKAQEPVQSFPPLFDDLIDGDSAGSQHTATNALIFTHTPGVGSLSGPVAATGELLITGTYELPEGLGSQGHALGVADGKDVDAVLIDGELAPASSPTPIAASSAVSTSKPAGEVIRPPAPEKGNKLMLTLAIVAGGLALALATVLIIAFTTNVFNN